MIHTVIYIYIYNRYYKDQCRARAQERTWLARPRRGAPEYTRKKYIRCIHIDICIHMCVYIYIYVCIHMCVYIYIYIYIMY